MQIYTKSRLGLRGRYDFFSRYSYNNKRQPKGIYKGNG